VNQIARNCENPTKVDYDAERLMLQYLKFTKDKSIYYKNNRLLVAYSDAD